MWQLIYLIKSMHVHHKWKKSLILYAKAPTKNHKGSLPTNHFELIYNSIEDETMRKMIWLLYHPWISCSFAKYSKWWGVFDTWFGYKVILIPLRRSNSQHKSQALPLWKCHHVASMSYFGLRTWDHVWSGKSQLSRSQWLRLHRLTSSDWLGT